MLETGQARRSQKFSKKYDGYAQPIIIFILIDLIYFFLYYCSHNYQLAEAIFSISTLLMEALRATPAEPA